MADKQNFVIVLLDTLRAAHLGCYGNRVVKTPNFDAFARTGVRFTRAFPESLPTIPARRALHTGRRAYPFRNWQPLKWGTVTIPGWQPLDNREDCLAENLAARGYQTGFVCTTQHCWNPGYNFQRGFWQWEFVRGYSGEDRWGSPYAVPREALLPYGDPDAMLERPHAGGGPPMVLANRGLRMIDEETATARAFRWAARFLADNRSRPFYLLIDSFAPHEPWEAPEKYYRLYGDPDYAGKKFLTTCYGPADRYSAEELRYIQAQYAGLVTHVDHWFGEFMNQLVTLGLEDETAVFVISDHGTNFCDNPRNVIGKPADAMYPGVMRLPLLARLPGGPGAGTRRDAFVYNHDLPATIYDLAGLSPEQEIHGQSLRPLITETPNRRTRRYVTCRYANAVCYIDDDTWAMGTIDANPTEIFDLATDPECRRNVAAGDRGRTRWSRAWERILADADGELPDYRDVDFSDALGRKLP